MNALHRIFWLVVALVAPVLPCGQSCADETPVSILREPENMELYRAPISASNFWIVRLHGIRNAPLDPSVWGERIDQRTENHRLISIKPYYLRSSEHPDYRVDKIEVGFVFRPAKPQEVLKNPHEKDSVLELRFGGELVLQPGGQEPERDRQYALRISGYPYVVSGLLYRSQLREVMLSPSKQVPLTNRTVHHLEGVFSDTSVAFKLDGETVGELKGSSLNKGLISLVSGWAPATFLSLEVDGHDLVHPGVGTLHESGLIALPKPERRRGQKAAGPQGNEVLDHALFRKQQDFEVSDGESSEGESSDEESPDQETDPAPDKKAPQ